MKRKIFLCTFFAFASSLCTYANSLKLIVVKDTIVQTSNGVWKIQINHYQYGEKNFYRVEIDDTISLPPTEEYYKPYSTNIDMKELIEKFFETSIPVFKQEFPNICNQVENDKLQNCVIQVYFDDQQKILKKRIKTRSNNLSDIYAFIDEILKENNLDNCLEIIRTQFFKDNNLPVYPREKFPEYLKKLIKEGKRGYYEMLPIRIEKRYLQIYYPN